MRLLIILALLLMPSGTGAADPLDPLPNEFELGAFDPVATLMGIITHAPAGDDIAFDDVRIRLRGIFAPENSSRSKEPGGQASEDALNALVADKFAICYLDGSTAGRSRPVAVCYIDVMDIGREQIRQGHALDCLKYSSGEYQNESQPDRMEPRVVARWENECAP